MNEDKIISDLFKSMEMIAEKKINDTDFPTILVGTVIERLFNSDSYSISYLNTEITASSIGGLYSKGDEVFIILPEGINKTKFILGNTNNRTPTFTFNGEGLSEKDLLQLQEIIKEIQDLTSDNIISPSEKQNLLIQWENIKKSYEEILELKKPYEGDINIDLLDVSYSNLKLEFDKIFSNMSDNTEIDGEAFRAMILGYLQLDKKARLDIQDALRKELTYKVDIFSTNGEAFKNNSIQTNLNAIVMKGKNIITESLPNSAIIWKKLDGSGNEIPGWSFIGRSVSITQDDVDGRQIFQVSIFIESAEVAKDIITIVDLNDIGALSVAVDIKESKAQIYNPEEKTYTPDYTVKNQILKAAASYAGKDISEKSTFTWSFNGVKVEDTDSRFIVDNSMLTIKKNILNPDTMSNGTIGLLVEYYIDEYQLTVDESRSFDFSCAKDGESPIIPMILTPKGTSIKNEGYDLQATFVLRRGEELITPSQINWFLSEDSIIWTPIALSSNMSTIAILRETINGVLHIKANCTYNGETFEASAVSFYDLLDSVNVSVIGSGIFKDGNPNTYTADIFLGQELIENPEEKYDIVWSITNETMRASLFNQSWPKRGQRISVLQEEIPDNNGVALVVNVFNKE